MTRRGFLRNVAVALGNLKSREAVPALIQALRDEEPLVRRHVAWALGQIGSHECAATLKERLRVERDPGVCGEIEEAIEEINSQSETDGGKNMTAARHGAAG